MAVVYPQLCRWNVKEPRVINVVYISLCSVKIHSQKQMDSVPGPWFADP